jgi:hypothetical protein
VEDVRDSPAGKCNERHTATIPSGAPERWRQRTNEYDMALAWADGSGTKRNAIVSEQWAGRALVGQDNCQICKGVARGVALYGTGNNCLSVPVGLTLDARG